MDLGAIARRFPACSGSELRIMPIADGLINATYRGRYGSLSCSNSTPPSLRIPPR